MMKDSLQKGPAYHFCPTMVNLFSLFISMFWLRTVDLHQVMVLVFTCWMFNFMLFILVLGTTALWLHYISKNIVGGALFAQKKSSKEKYNSVCTSKRPLSFTTIYSSGFFFFQLLTKKKSCDLVTKRKNLGKLIIYHFWPLFVTKINFFAVRIPEHGVYSSPPTKMWNAFHSSKTWVHFK